MLERAKIDIAGLGGSYGTESLTLFEMLPEMGPPIAHREEWKQSDESWALELEACVQAIDGAAPRGASIDDAVAALSHRRRCVPGSRDVMNHRVEHCPACRSLDLRVDRVGVWGTSDLLACNTCRTQFLSPQPDDARLAEIYGEDYYVPWGVETAEAIDAMKRMTFEPMLDGVRARPRVAPCSISGARPARSWPRRRAGARRPTGSTSTPVRSRWRRSACPKRGCTPVSPADRPFAGVSFDAVVMIDFIEHVRDPEAELEVVRDDHPPRLAAGDLHAPGRLAAAGDRPQALAAVPRGAPHLLLPGGARRAAEPHRASRS